MNYSKTFLTILFIFCSQLTVAAFYPQHWTHIPKGGVEINEQAIKNMSMRELGKFQAENCIKLDTESINEHNDSLYYAIEYKGKDGFWYISIIQSKGYRAGIVKTYKSELYSEIMQDHISNAYPPLMPQVAGNFKEITPSSMIYHANKKAMEISGFNGDIDLGNADFTTYMKNVEKLIKKNWNPSPRDIDKGSYKVVVKFKVAKNGRVINCNVINSSGNQELDEAAICAIRGLSFGALPQNYKGYSVDIQFSFDYNVR